MCLSNISIEKTKETKKSKKIIGYKILKSDDTSVFQNYLWKKGLNISNRKSTSISKRMMHIEKGFHFFADKPKLCTISNSNDFCKYYCSRKYEFQCTNENPYNKVVKFEIDSKDLVAIGTWKYTRKNSSFVATKATWIEEI